MNFVPLRHRNVESVSSQTIISGKKCFRTDLLSM